MKWNKQKPNKIKATKEKHEINKIYTISYQASYHITHRNIHTDTRQIYFKNTMEHKMVHTTEALLSEFLVFIALFTFFTQIFYTTRAMRLASVVIVIFDSKITSNALSNDYIGVRSRLWKPVFMRKLVFDWFSWKPVFGDTKTACAIENFVKKWLWFSGPSKTSFRWKPVLEWFSWKPVFDRFSEKWRNRP